MPVQLVFISGIKSKEERKRKGKAAVDVKAQAFINKRYFDVVHAYNREK